MPMRPKITGPTLGGGGLKCLRDQLTEDGSDMGAGGAGAPGRRPFLRRGEGRLGMTTLPTSASKDAPRPGPCAYTHPGILGENERKAQPVQRSLSLARPASARGASSQGSDADSFEEEEAPKRSRPAMTSSATSYIDLLAQREVLRKTPGVGARPASAPPRRSASPDEPVPRDPKKLFHASALSTAEGRRLQSMMKPVLLSTGRGGAGLSSSPNRSPTSSALAAGHGEANWDDVSRAIMRRARGEKQESTFSQAVADEHSGVGGAGDGPAGRGVGAGGRTGGGEDGRTHSGVDFSPVLMAVQGKLAALTQENIALKEQVQAAQTQLSALDQQYEGRLQAEVTRMQLETSEQVRLASQAIRIRERQQDAFGKKGDLDKRNRELEALRKELRAAKQDVHARESVLNQTIDRLKRTIKGLETTNSELQEQMQRMELELRQAQAGGSGLSTEIESLRKELNIALAENAKLRGVHAAEAGILRDHLHTRASTTSAAAKYLSAHAGASSPPPRTSSPPGLSRSPGTYSQKRTLSSDFT